VPFREALEKDLRSRHVDRLFFRTVSLLATRRGLL
jgi:hypothetical protein